MNTKTKAAAYRIIENAEYTKRWFDAGSFFNTFYMSSPIKGKFFITGDMMMTFEKWAVREITPSGITTHAGPLDTRAEAEEFLSNMEA
jgi:hypothetical protein